MTDALAESPVIDPASNPAVVDPSLDSRAATFENPTGARGAGGTAHGGRKGAPNRRLEPGERVVLADIEGPGVIRHIWMTFPPARPRRCASLYLEVFYDDLDAPSVSVPCLDFFGLPHGRPVAYALGARPPRRKGAASTATSRCRSVGSVRVELVNGVAAAHDALLPGRLHAAGRPPGRARAPARDVPAREPDGACGATS